MPKALRVGLIFAIASVVVGTGSGGATNPPQHYTTGTSCDDAWQEGPFPGNPTGINPSSTYKQTTMPTGWDGQGHTFNPGIRYENVQSPGTSDILHVYADAYPFDVHSIDLPVQVELGPSNDFCYQNDIINRTYTAAIDYHADNLNPNGQWLNIDITGLVRQITTYPASIVVRFVGEDGRIQYPNSYGWEFVTYDCHCGLSPSLDVFG